MREIKFRVWDGEKMRRVGEIDFAVDLGPSYWGRDVEEQRFNAPCDQFMQFTGLHDAEGTEIWEGDLIPYGGANWSVHQKDGCWQILWDGGVSIGYILNELRVVGNIYETEEVVVDA